MANDNDSGIWSWFSGASSIGVGATVGHFAFTRQKSNKAINAFTPVLDSRSTTLNRIQQINASGVLDKQIKSFQIESAVQRLSTLQELTKKASSTKVPAGIGDSKKSFYKLDNSLYQTNLSIVQREWQAAINAAFPNPLEAKVMSGDDVFKTIEMSMRHNPSTLMQRAYSSFNKNMAFLTSNNFAGGTGMLKVGDFVKSAPDIARLESLQVSSIKDLKLRQILEQMQEATNQNLVFSKRSIGAQGEISAFLRGSPEALFTIPESFAATEGFAPGLIRTGTGLQNVYAPGLFAIANKEAELSERLTFSQYKAKRILDVINESGTDFLSSSTIAKIREASEETGKLADYMEPNISGSGFSSETFAKSNRLTVLDELGRPVTGDLKRSVTRSLYQDKLIPVSSDSSYSLLPEENLFGSLAAYQDNARKPGQIFRQYSSTEAAQQAAANNPYYSSNFEFLDSPLKKHLSNKAASARVQTLYLNPDQIQELQDKFKISIGDGELLVNSKIKEELQASRSKRVNLFEINTDLAEQFKSRGISLDSLSKQVNLEHNPINIKGLLGRTAEGSLESTRYRTDIVGISPNFTKNLKGTPTASLDLIVRETIDMSDAEKVFGGLKGTARFLDLTDPKSKFLQAVSQVTGRSVESLQDVSVFARLKDIKDSAREMQAVAGSVALSAQKQNISADISSFINANKTSSIENFTANAAQLAQSIGVKSDFDLKAGGLSVTDIYFGGMKELSGAGNIATIEPRMFTLLEASNPGGMGSDISNELLERAMAFSPEKSQMSQELLETLKSAYGEKVPEAGDAVFSRQDLFNKANKEALLSKGGFIDTGVKEIGKLYVPGYENVAQLHPRLASTGSLVDSAQASKIFRNIIDDVVSLDKNSSGLTEEDFIDKFQKPGGYFNQILQEAAVEGKGGGGISRGPLPGSRALWAASEVSPTDPSSFLKQVDDLSISSAAKERVVGLPINQAEDMFREMESLYGSDKVRAMRDRFMRGELIAGMAMRHPVIDPYSTTPVLFKAVKTSEPILAVPERTRSMSFSSSGGKGVATVQTGILAGLGLDKDGDTVAAMLLSPDMEEKMRNQILVSKELFDAQDKAYQDHSLRMQLLKPKAAAGIDTGMSLADRRVAEAVKLGITKEEVGLLSSNLSKARKGIMSSNLPQPRKLKAMSLLTWLEQQPISGKHVAVSQAISGAFEMQIDALKSGVSGNARLLEGTISDMAEGVAPELKDLFKGGITDTSTGRFIEGWDITQTSNDIAESSIALRQMPSQSELGAATKYAQPSKRIPIKLEDLSTAVGANTSTPSSKAVQMSRNAIADINKTISNAVQKAKPYAKPIMLGLAAAGLANAILSPGPSRLEGTPIGSPPPPMNNQTRDDIEPSEAETSSQQLGNPTTSVPIQNSSTEISNSGFERQKSLRAKINTNNLSENQREALTQRINRTYPNSQLNVRVNDNRRSVSPQSISDLME